MTRHDRHPARASGAVVHHRTTDDRGDVRGTVAGVELGGDSWGAWLLPLWNDLAVQSATSIQCEPGGTVPDAA
jgi:hypothetical protein